MYKFIPGVHALLAILLFAEGCLSQQATSLSVTAKQPCKQGLEFFDISTLTCQKCDLVRDFQYIT
jgi:hypothetical protein